MDSKQLKLHFTSVSDKECIRHWSGCKGYVPGVGFVFFQRMMRTLYQATDGEAENGVKSKIKPWESSRKQQFQSPCNETTFVSLRNRKEGMIATIKLVKEREVGNKVGTLAGKQIG